jgi:hypothetical protein
MNKILIVQLALGPTYKARLLHNLQTYPAYDKFDIFIMTDEVEYFNQVSYKSNLYVNNIDEIRKDYPWSIELEKIPPVINDETEFAKYYLENNVKIPTLLQRFSLNWEKASDYNGFIWMDCDVLPLVDSETYDKLEAYFATKEDKVVILPVGGAYNMDNNSYIKDFALCINDKYKITNKEIVDNNFLTTDGNFRTLKFPSKEYTKYFFELLNNIVYDVLTDNQYFLIGVHTMWNLHSENILSILFNLLEAKGYPWSEERGIDRNNNNSFKLCGFPEDRFWNWGMNMEPSTIGKQDFIDKNYDKLKKYYIDHFQKFPY